MGRPAPHRRLLPLAALLLLGASLAACQENPDESMEDCAAVAMAMADPDSSIADAVSNAVAMTFSESIKCNDSTPLNSTDTEALSIALAVAISGTSNAALECTSDAEAAANITSMVVAEEVKSALNNATNATTDQMKIAEARADALGDDVMEVIMEQTQPGCPPEQTTPCIVPLALPSPEEVADLVEKAILDILTEIQCGEEDEGSGEECKYVDGKFVGDCLDVPAAPPSDGGEPEEVDGGDDSGDGEPRCLFLNGRLIC
eukprot:evm.model.scf_161.2 EVM.evm.TU.scf_161.2   scf_161:8313-9529(+)